MHALSEHTHNRRSAVVHVVVRAPWAWGARTHAPDACHPPPHAMLPPTPRPHADFIGLAVCTIYIGAHRALTTKARQQISIKEVRALPSCCLQA